MYHYYDTTLILSSCAPYTEFPPIRSIYLTECEGSPIDLGTLNIYDTDATFIHFFHLDHQYGQLGAYLVNLENDTYIFKLHSENTNQTAYFKMALV